MTAFDDKFVPLATKLLAKFGIDATITVENTGDTYDPTTGTYTSAGADATHVIKVTPPYPYRNYLEASDISRHNRLTAYFAAENLPFDPLVDRWKMTLDGKTYENMEINPLQSGDKIAAYELILEK
jgi:hypothetical protein